MAEEVSAAPDPREMDMLLSTGERISCALCAMAINDLGHRAISLTGSQAGIVTDTSHTKARILDVRADRIRAASTRTTSCSWPASRASRRATTSRRSARGGSDTTAVAVAAAARRRDLRDLHRRAGRLQRRPADRARRPQAARVSFEEMLEMAASGAGVLQLRSVEYARNHGVRIHCRSSFEDAPGTVVVSEGETVEQPLITAVTHSTAEARVTLDRACPTSRARPRASSRRSAEANVNVDMIVQNEPTSAGGRAEISFTVPHEDLRVATRRA